MSNDGLYPKYKVEKISDSHRKHADCRYFVLDPQHDPIALSVLAQYAYAARHGGNEALYRELMDWCNAIEDDAR